MADRFGDNTSASFEYVPRSHNVETSSNNRNQRASSNRDAVFDLQTRLDAKRLEEWCPQVLFYRDEQGVLEGWREDEFGDGKVYEDDTDDEHNDERDEGGDKPMVNEYDREEEVVVEFRPSSGRAGLGKRLGSKVGVRFSQDVQVHLIHGMDGSYSNKWGPL